MSARHWSVLGMCLAACASSRSRADTHATDDQARASAIDVHGSLSTRWRGRFGAGAHDQDARALLSLDAGDPERKGWSAALVAEADADLDGKGGAFTSSADTSDGDVRARLHEAWVDHHGEGAIEHVRLGRQSDWATPVLAEWDGVRVGSREFSPLRARLSAYGGIPARYDSAAHSDDRLFGACAELRPWTQAWTRADWMHVEDRAYFGDASDDLVSLSVRQGIGERIGLEAGASALNGDGRDVRASARYDDGEHGLTLRASFYRLADAQNQLALDFDPFTRVLLEQFPYTRVGLSASQAVGAHARVEAGWETRQVSEPDDEGPFNRDFERGFLTTAFTDLFRSRLDLSVTGERWNSGTDDTAALSVDLSRALGERARIAVGTSYALYEYDLFQLEERDHVRAWYVAWRLRRRAGASFDVRYQHEDALHDYDTLRAGATWSF